MIQFKAKHLLNVVSFNIQVKLTSLSRFTLSVCSSILLVTILNVLMVFLNNTWGDEITGTDISDNLDGTINSDIIMGLAGNDKLYGSSGPDQLEGGAGADYFDCGKGIDKIIDYSSQQGDIRGSNCEDY
jgi:Ca2+-binding RTX toxin-like protein